MIPSSIISRFGFKTEWDSTTLFIVNLACSDFLYCAIALPLYAIQYLEQQWPFSEFTCIFFGFIRYIIAFADWMSLAFIAISRCLGLIKPKIAEKCLSGGNGFLIICGIWIYALILVLPAATGVSEDHSNTLW